MCQERKPHSKTFYVQGSSLYVFRAVYHLRVRADLFRQTMLCIFVYMDHSLRLLALLPWKNVVLSNQQLPFTALYIPKMKGSVSRSF